MHTRIKNVIKVEYLIGFLTGAFGFEVIVHAGNSQNVLSGPMSEVKYS